jgi:hypothetical protein
VRYWGNFRLADLPGVVGAEWSVPVSNLRRTMRNRRPGRLQLLLLLLSLTLSGSTVGQTPVGANADPAPGQSHATGSDPGKGRSNSSQSALDTVSAFYAYIIRYQPLGIPQGRAKKALWPLLSKRLVQELDSLQACEDDYYRRYGDILRANHFKPETPWLEEGLFSGPNEAASPMKFSVLSRKSIGENRVDVHLRFTHKQTYCCGHPTSYEHYEGLVTVIRENGRFVIDDFVALYENDALLHLSDGYRECKGGQWVRLPEQQSH